MHFGGFLSISHSKIQVLQLQCWRLGSILRLQVRVAEPRFQHPLLCVDGAALTLCYLRCCHRYTKSGKRARKSDVKYVVQLDAYGLFSLISITKVLDPDKLAAAVISIHIAYFAFEAVVKASHWVGRVPNCVHSLVKIVLVLL